MNDVRKLDSFNLAKTLANRIYDIVSLFPEDEKYGLSSQMKRAAVSIFSNMAEGCGRRTDKDLLLFLYHSSGSLKELESQLEFAAERRFVAEEAYKSTLQQLQDVARTLFGLIRYYENKIHR